MTCDRICTSKTLGLIPSANSAKTQSLQWFSCFPKGPRLISQFDHFLELLMHTIHTVQRHDAQAYAFAHGFADSAKADCGCGIGEGDPHFPSKIEWNLPNGPLRKVLELLDTQV